MAEANSTLHTFGMPTATTRSHSYRRDIDGLRAVAVLAVLANHIDHALLPGGFLGVDMFFVISGFVITGSLLSRPAENFAQFLLSFYERRIRRILPALLLCIIITFLVASLFITPGTTIASSTWQTGLWALFGVSNIYLGLNSTDYFSSSTALNPFTQTWSLGIEEQFYFVYPILFFAAFRASKSNQKSCRKLVVWITIAGIASLAGYLLVGEQASWPYFSSPLRFWELAAGCLACCLRQHFQNLHARFLSATSWVSIAICITSLTYADIPMAGATILVVAGSALLLACNRDGENLYRILAAKLIRPIGLSSYSIYLWHWSVLSIARWTVGVSSSSIPYILLATLILSYASYTWIETPLRHSPWSTDKKRTLLIGIGGIIAGAGALFGLRADNNSPLYAGKICKLSGYETCTPKSSPHPPVTPHISNTSIQRTPCFIDALETGLTSEFLRTCSTKLSDSLPRLFVAGDSFAASLSPAVDKLYKSEKFNITYLSAPGCALDIYNTRARRTGCSTFDKERYRILSKMTKPGDAILISASSNLGYNNTSIQTLSKLKKDLNRRNVSIIVQQPMPRLEKETPDICYEPRQAFNNGNQQFANCSELSSISYADFLERTRLPRNELKRIENGNNFLIWDPNGLICRDGRCYSHRNGIRLYRDTHHFSVSGAQLAAPSLQNALQRAGFAKNLGTSRDTLSNQ